MAKAMKSKDSVSDTKDLLDKLSDDEVKALHSLKNNKTLSQVSEDTGMQEVKAMRACQWLSNKGLVIIESENREVITLDKNGSLYAKKGLPEKRFLEAIKKDTLSLDEIGKKAGLDKNELGVCIGLLKKKGAVEVNKGPSFTLTDIGKKFLAKPSLEEKFLDGLKKEGISENDLGPEEKYAFDELKKRPMMIKIDITKIKHLALTPSGKKLSAKAKNLKKRIEKLTPEMLKRGSWKNMDFRRYDVNINVPKIDGGKRHFVSDVVDYARRVWMDMGFEEMAGPYTQTSFWNFDALFTSQDHPVRDMQDTFFIKTPAKGNLPDKKTKDRVKAAHENGGDTGSIGWRYSWDEEEAKKVVLRTHTTCLSAKTLASLKEKDLPKKFFAVGRNFRNETMDWSHLFEFNQFEGIVIDKDANFRNLLGYLKEFFRKIGFPKARFRPAHFPYTEPSVEIDVFHPVHKKWVELGGAGIFRPEVVKPLLGIDVPVLAWGPGLDRQLMEYFKLTDIRDLYKNDIRQLRELKKWMK